MRTTKNQENPKSRIKSLRVVTLRLSDGYQSFLKMKSLSKVIEISLTHRVIHVDYIKAYSNNVAVNIEPIFGVSRQL